MPFLRFAGGEAAAGPALRSGWPEGPDPAAQGGAGPSEQRAPKHSGGRPEGGRGPKKKVQP